MVAEPSAGIYTTQIGLDMHGAGDRADLLFVCGGGASGRMSRGRMIGESRKGSYESSTIDDVDEDDELDQYLDDEEEEEDARTETDMDTRTDGESGESGTGRVRDPSGNNPIPSHQSVQNR